MTEYGVSYPGGLILIHKGEDTARAAVDRAQKLPGTKGAHMLKRTIAEPGPWENA